VLCRSIAPSGRSPSEWTAKSRERSVWPRWGRSSTLSWRSNRCGIGQTACRHPRPGARVELAARPSQGRRLPLPQPGHWWSRRGPRMLPRGIEPLISASKGRRPSPSGTPRAIRLLCSTGGIRPPTPGRGVEPRTTRETTEFPHHAGPPGRTATVSRCSPSCRLTASPFDCDGSHSVQAVHSTGRAGFEPRSLRVARSLIRILPTGSATDV
jgi:hypothetical protein